MMNTVVPMNKLIAGIMNHIFVSNTAMNIHAFFILSRFAGWRLVGEDTMIQQPKQHHEEWNKYVIQVIREVAKSSLKHIYCYPTEVVLAVLHKLRASTCSWYTYSHLSVSIAHIPSSWNRLFTSWPENRS